ncbi:MAG TPA: ATP-binding protein [Chloroflexota bacterium]|nr:ATP-binding protein [Chloroflexota bacterium]
MTLTPVPRLILIGGAPASGKTTLAERLATELSLPLLTKDLFKEALFDSLGIPADRERSAELSRAAFTILYRVAARLIGAGNSLILESNFHRGRSERDLLPLVERTRAIALYCDAPEEELHRRYQERIHTGLRHPGHLDWSLSVFEEQARAGLYEPLDLPIPALRIDTSHGYEPDYAEIRQFAVSPNI